MEALWHTVWWNAFLKTRDTKPICVKAGKGNDHAELVWLLISCKVFCYFAFFNLWFREILCSVTHFDRLSQRDVSTYSPCVDVFLRSVRNPRPSFANPQRACVLHWPKTFQCAAFSCDLFRLLHFWHPCTRVFHEVQRREDELKICGLQHWSETTWQNLKNKVKHHQSTISFIVILFHTVRESREFRYWF